MSLTARIDALAVRVAEEFATVPYKSAAATISGLWNFATAPTIQGNTIWHAGNFNPDSKAPASGSANYIQNQIDNAQSANMWISGTGVFNNTLSSNLYQGIHPYWGTAILGNSGSYAELGLLDRNGSYIMLTPSGSRAAIFASTVSATDIFATSNLYSANNLYLYSGKTVQFDRGASTDFEIGKYSDYLFYNSVTTGSHRFNSTVKAPTFQSTVATGTAPLTVASSTMVSNLNAEYLGGLKSERYIRQRYSSISDGVVGIDAMSQEQTFAYYGAGAPTNGGMISFGGFDGAYQTQLIGAYIGGNDFFIRTQNSDNATWNPWRTLYHSGNLPNPVSGTGTVNNIPKWGTTTSLTASLVSDDGTKVQIGDSNFTGIAKFNVASDYTNVVSKSTAAAYFFNLGVGVYIGGSEYSFGYIQAEQRDNTAPKQLKIQPLGGGTIFGDEVSIPSTTTSTSTTTGALTVGGGLGVGGAINGAYFIANNSSDLQASFSKHGVRGTQIVAYSGSVYDFSLITPSASSYIMGVPVGTQNVRFFNNINVDGGGTFGDNITSTTAKFTAGAGTGKVWTSSDNAGNGVWATPNYDNYGGWSLLANSTNATSVLSGGTVNFIQGTNVSISKTGNAITINVPTIGVEAAYVSTNFAAIDHTHNYSGVFAATVHTHAYDNYGGWSLLANSTNASSVLSGGTVDFIQGDNVSISKSGNEIRISVPTIGAMVYPSAGIAVSTGSAWGASIANNSANWNSAYDNMYKVGLGYYTGGHKMSAVDFWYDSSDFIVLQKTDEISSGNNYPATSHGVFGALQAKQAALVSGTNIKTINGASILGSGDLTVGGSAAHSITSHTDVAFTYSPSNGDLMQYNGAAWTQRSINAAGIAALAGSTSQAFGVQRLNLPGGGYIEVQSNNIHIYPGSTQVVVHGQVTADSFYKN